VYWQCPRADALAYGHRPEDDSAVGLYRSIRELAKSESFIRAKIIAVNKYKGWKKVMATLL
jgi:hypothetical protein